MTQKIIQIRDWIPEFKVKHGTSNSLKERKSKQKQRTSVWGPEGDKLDIASENNLEKKEINANERQ